MSLIRAETERCDIVSFSKVTTKSLASEQALRSQMNQVRANLPVNVVPSFFPCENQLYRVPRQRDSTSGKLN